MEDPHNQMKLMPHTKQYSYRPEIDGIRAFAVAAVIINHFNKELLPSGYLGVDIFFVISGFVITSSLTGRLSNSFLDFLVSFYTRRIKRLVPALVLFVLINCVLVSLFNPNPDISIKTGITSLFGLSNLFLLKLSTDYFAASPEQNFFLHTWSLGVEEQFYFLFPFLLWFTGFSRQASKGSRAFFWIMCILSIASLIDFVYTYPTNQPAAYFLMPTRLWELGAGCLLFLGLKNSNKVLLTLSGIPPLTVTGAVVSVLFIPTHYAVQATIAAVVLTAVLLVCLRPETFAYHLFTHPKVVFIGLISYSLYLWHWSILSLSLWTIGIYWWSVPFQIALMLLLAIASYQYVEKPLRRSDWSVVRWHSIAYGMSAAILAAALLTALVKIPGISLYSGKKPPMVAVGKASLKDPYVLEQVSSVWRGEKCILSEDSDFGKEILVENCTLGNFSKAKRRIMVFGNSFSPAFTQAFDELVVSDGYSVTITSSTGALPIETQNPNGTWAKLNNYYLDNIFPSLINQLRPGDCVFLVYDMQLFSPKYKTPKTTELLKRLESSLEVLSGKLSERGIKLAILHGIPFAREAKCEPAAAAKQWFSPFGGPCKLPGRSESLSRRDNLNKVLVSFEKKGNLHIVDLFDVFCFEDQCTYNAKNGQFLYRDEDSHPSVEAARLSAPIIRKVLTSL